jgi:hypothetical protein
MQRLQLANRQAQAGSGGGGRTTSTSLTPLSSSMRRGKLSSGRLATGSSTLGVPEALRGYSRLPPPPASSIAVQLGICSIAMPGSTALDQCGSAMDPTGAIKGVRGVQQ